MVCTVSRWVGVGGKRRGLPGVEDFSDLDGICHAHTLGRGREVHLLELNKLLAVYVVVLKLLRPNILAWKKLIIYLMF